MLAHGAHLKSRIGATLGIRLECVVCSLLFGNKHQIDISSVFVDSLSEFINTYRGNHAIIMSGLKCFES